MGGFSTFTCSFEDAYKISQSFGGRQYSVDVGITQLILKLTMITLLKGDWVFVNKVPHESREEKKAA